MRYGERLREARNAQNLTQQELADRSGVPQGTISKIERGDQEASSYDSILADALEVSAIWLTTGKGSMTVEYKENAGNHQHKEVREPGPFDFTQDEIDLVRQYRQLSAEEQRIIRVSIRGLIDNGQSAAKQA